MTTKVVPVAIFAERAGVSIRALYKAASTGRLPAIENGMVDIGHQAAQAYLERRRTPPRKKRQESREELEARKLEAQCRHLELKNAEREGKLVLRETVDRAVFNPINTVFVRLLTDVSKTMAANVVPMVKGGAMVEEIEKHIREQHSTVLKNLKKQMAAALETEDEPV